MAVVIMLGFVFSSYAMITKGAAGISAGEGGGYSMPVLLPKDDIQFGGGDQIDALKNFKSQQTEKTKWDKVDELIEALDTARNATNGNIGNMAAYLKAPKEAIAAAIKEDYTTRCLECSGDRPIPTVAALITTKGSVTNENLDNLKRAGYEVIGSMGSFVQVKAPVTTFLNLNTGLYNFNWIQSVFSPPETINN